MRLKCHIFKFSHRSCSSSLFCLFHCSLKSVENSCQTEKNVLGETSFSPALGLTEKDTLNSKKLMAKQKYSRFKAKLLQHQVAESCSGSYEIWQNYVQNIKVNLRVQ